jgi:hypothetical protein
LITQKVAPVVAPTSKKIRDELLTLVFLSQFVPAASYNRNEPTQRVCLASLFIDCQFSSMTEKLLTPTIVDALNERVGLESSTDIW